MNNKNRALSLVSAFLLIGFIAVSIISYWSARSSLSEQIVSEVVPLTGISIYSKIKEQLMAPIQISALMAQDTFVHDWVHNGEIDSSKMQRYLTEIQQRNNAITSFFVSAKTLNYYHPKGVLKQVSTLDTQDKWYFDVEQSTQDYIVNIDLDTRDLQSLTVFINYKVIDSDGVYLGAIGIGLSVSSVKQLLDRNNPHQQFMIFFANKQGKVMLQGESDTQLANLSEIHGLSPHLNNILSQEKLATSFVKDAKTAHINSRYLPELGWYLMIIHTEQMWDSRIIKPLLVNLLIGLLISVLVILVVFYTLKRYQGKLENMAVTDQLTGASNRHGFERIVNKLLNSKSKDKFAVVLFDLDDFKQINDSYTHLAGDKVICEAANIVRKITKGDGNLVRWGGEEFLLILPGCSLEQAVEVAENIRQTFAEHQCQFNQQIIKFTASFGVVEGVPQQSFEHLLHRIDQSLYQAKQSGKNQVQAA